MDLKYIHNVETAAQQAEGFTVIFFLKLNINFKLLLEKDIVSCATHLKKKIQPRTEMEKEIAQILNSSKNNLTNDDVYTEAELEIIRAMNLKEVGFSKIILPHFTVLIFDFRLSRSSLKCRE